MKTKVIHRRILAPYTVNAEQIGQLMTECEAITMPEKLYQTAADLATSVYENTPNKDMPWSVATAATYILRYAYMLSQSGQLVEAPPKPKRRTV